MLRGLLIMVPAWRVSASLCSRGRLLIPAARARSCLETRIFGKDSDLVISELRARYHYGLYLIG